MKQEENTQQTNLGEGSVGKLLLKLALPAIVAQMVNMLYNMVDRIYIGHIPEVGDLALTGLGLCFPIIMLISAFASLIGSGGAPRAAIFMGKGKTEEGEKILGNCVASVVLISVVLTVLLEIFGEKILFLFGASENTIVYALPYMRIYVAGTIFVMISLGLNTFITTQGYAQIAMKTVMIGAVCNIVLDPIFIFVFDMGVKGAAWATILSQCISAVWVLLFLTGSKTKLRICREYLRINPQIILPVLALGVAPFIMSSTESILNVAFNASLSKYGGDVAVGAMTILSSIMQLMFMPAQGLAQGAQPIISYNYGAGKVDRVRKAYRILITTCFLYTMIFWMFLNIFPEFFVSLFNSSSPELMEMTVWALGIYMAGSGVFGIQSGVQQTFVSLGQAKLSLFIACLRKIILLIPLIYILPEFMEDKIFAVFLAEPVADFISVTVASLLFFLNINKILERVDLKD